MVSVTDQPPADVAADIAAMRALLDTHVPAISAQNLIIGTWNIRAFGNLTKKWHASDHDSPKRDFHAVRLIAEVIKRFDVVAVQEVKDNIRALRHTLKVLGSDWGFLMTDVTRGDPGNGERLAFLYNSKRLKPSGLAAELVIPEDDASQYAIPANAFQRQFVRTPYAVSFLAGTQTFILVTLHVFYGKKDAPEDRIPELKAIAAWLAHWARQAESFGHNLIALGDFNIDRTGDDLYDAFTSTGLVPAKGLENLPRTIWSTPEEPEKEKHYDQIAWFTKASGVPYLSMTYKSAGNVPFVGHVMADLPKTSMSFRMSDHFPIFTEFTAG